MGWRKPRGVPGASSIAFLQIVGINQVNFWEINTMKARASKPTSAKTIIALALLIVPALALAAVREPASVSGEVFATEEGPLVGPARLTAAHETFSGEVQVIPVGGMLPKPDGSWEFPDVLHVFNLYDAEGKLIGTLATTGDEFAAPIPIDEQTGVYTHTLHGNMEIIDATGVLPGVSGELRVNGKIDLSFVRPPSASFEAHGVISR